jgi:predicted Zn finger-like uncharacterized protein
MIKVECEACQAPYQIDPKRVPPTGLKMRCPKCGHSFVVSNPDATGPLPAAVVAPKPAPPALGGMNFDDPLADLPAFSAPKKPAAAPAAPSPAAPAFGAFSFGDLGDLGDLDLPANVAPASFADLPAAARPKPAARPAAPAFDDLPVAASRSKAPAPPSAPLPAAKAPAFGFGDLDLPSPAGFGGLDLPSSGNSGGFGNLPAAKSGGFGDLPVAKSGGFGDLPAKSGGFGDLPAAKPGGFGDFGSLDLPSPGGFGSLDLPSAPGAPLPMPKAGGGFGDFGEIALPSNLDAFPMPGGGNLPAPQNSLPSASASLPTPMGQDKLLPATGGPAGFDFGELDLPPAPDAFALPPPPGGSLPPPPTGDYGYSGGEGDDLSIDVAASPRVAISGAEGSGLALGGPAAEAPKRQQDPTVQIAALKERQAMSRKRLMLLGGFAATLLVGGLLQLTPLGAFGHLAIIDAVSKGKYDRFASEGWAEVQAASGLDLYVDTRTAADHIHTRHEEAPRAQKVSELAAVAEYIHQVRFGIDGGRATRADQDVAAIPAEKRSPLLKGAQAAAKGDYAGAKADLASVAGETEWVAKAMLGEIALRTNDLPGAEAAFQRSIALSDDAKGHFGLARVLFRKGETAKAKDELTKVFAKSPKHADGKLLSARIYLEKEHDEKNAEKSLADLIGPNAKDTIGVLSAAQARSLAGFLALANGKTQAAKEHFDAATKLEPQNVIALLGLGELLYADSRYTEALGRFDAAVNADPSSIPAIIGSAKTKVGLERLADAKTQLTDAIKRMPKAWPLHLWLGKTQEALGDKSGAEKEYRAAVDGLNAKDQDAISPYVALASLLAAQGRAEDAQAKLEEAKGKLPPSAAMDRAFAEVAAAQGKFEAALAFLATAKEKNPDDAATTFRLGVTLRRMRRLEDASVEFDRVAAKEPDFPGLALERGLLFEESGQLEKAITEFKNALSKAPSDIDLQLRVGAAYVAANNVKEALPLLQKVLTARPNSAEANHYLARAYLRQGGSSIAAAMRFAKRSVELDPNRAEYHLYVAWVANETVPPALGTARDAVEKALALDSLLADAYWQRGVVEQREAKILDAQKDLQRALELKPGRLEAHATLAESLEDQNKPELALGEWAKAIVSPDARGYWHYRYGRLLAEKGRGGDALPELEKAFAEGDVAEPRPGWVAPAAFSSAELLQKAGKRPEAIARFKRYLEVAPFNSPDRSDAEAALKALGAK